MNNKGFIFAETLATTAVIFIMLISFYIFSLNFIDNQSKYKNYNNIEEIYKIANVRLFLYRTINFNKIIDKLDEKNTTCISLKNVTFEDDENKTIQYNNILNKFDLDQIYLCNLEKSNDFTDDFKDYFEYTKKEFNDKYKIIANFRNDKFASIKVWRISNE